MGENGYSILVWDSYGCGLVKVNPKLHSEGVDLYGNDDNWWPCPKETTVQDVDVKHNLSAKYGNNFKVIFDRT